MKMEERIFAKTETKKYTSSFPKKERKAKTKEEKSQTKWKGSKTFSLTMKVKCRIGREQNKF